ESECSLPSTVTEVTSSARNARLQRSAASDPVMTPRTTLPAGMGAAVPITTGSFTTPVQVSPVCAVSEVMLASIVTLIGVPPGTVTPGFAAGRRAAGLEAVGLGLGAGACVGAGAGSGVWAGV